MLSRTPFGHTFGRSNFSRDPHCRVFFEPDNGANNNGGDNNQQGNQSDNPSQNPNNQSQNNQGNQSVTLSDVNRLIEEVRNSNRAGGSWEETARILAGRIRADESRNSDSVVITKEQNADLEAAQQLLQAVGAKSFTELKKRIEAGDAATTKWAEHERTKSFREACEAAGYDADAVLEVIGEVPESEVAVEGEGESAVRKARLTVMADGKSEKKPFEDVIKARFPKTHESLRAQQSQSQQGGSTRKVVPYGKGPAAGAGSGSSVYSQIRERNQAETEKGKSFMEKAKEAGMVAG